MTSSPDDLPRPASRTTRPSGVARDELAKLRGRILGDCAACGRTVYFEHNFTRLNGCVVHVRCPVPLTTARLDSG
jgi:hypothetical protein